MAPPVAGTLIGVTAVVVAMIAAVVMLAIESVLFDKSRGAWGGLSRRARGWLHSQRDHDVSNALLAGVLAMAPPAAAVVLVTIALHDERVDTAFVARLCTVILALGAGAPVVAALAGAPGSTHRLALDSALTELCRWLCLIGAPLALAHTPLLAVGATTSTVLFVRRTVRPPSGFQPVYDAGVSDGTALVLDGGARLTATATALLAGLSLTQQFAWHGAVAVPVALVVIAVSYGVTVVFGPERAVGASLRVPLFVLLGAIALGLAVATFAADAPRP